MSTVVAFLAHNRLAYTRQCLEALRESLYLGKFGQRLVLIDNASTDGTREYLQSVKGAEFIGLDENVGLARGFNAAMARCGSEDFFVRVNNDFRIERRGWLGSLLDWTARLPDAGQLSHFWYDCRVKGVPPQVGEQGAGWLRCAYIHAGLALVTPAARRAIGGFWLPPGDVWGSLSEDYGTRLAVAGLRCYYVDTPNVYYTHVHEGKKQQLSPGALHDHRLRQTQYRHGALPIYREIAGA